MSRQNAELSEDFASTDSRLDAILAQLNALAAPDASSRPAKPTPHLAEAAPDLSESEPESDLPDPAPVEPPPLPDAAASAPKPPMPGSTFPSRPLQSVPDIDEALLADESVFDVAPAPDIAPDPSEAPASPPMLGLVPSPVETPPLAPPPVPLDAITHDEPEPEPEPEPVVVEYRAQDVPDETVVADESTEPAPVEITIAKDSPQVFVLDGPLETDTIAAPMPAPVPIESEFGPPVDAEAEAEAEPDFETPSEGEFAAPEDSDPGWVSHHTAEPAEAADQAMSTDVFGEATEQAVASTGNDFEALMNDLESVFEADEEIERDEPESSFGAPQWTDAVEDVIEAELDITPEPQYEARTEPLTREEPSVMADGVEHHFGSDEDLPIPDFTGVWVDSDEPSVWDNDGSSERLLPGPVEGGRNKNGISVGRNELDSLRPVEEEVVSQPAPNLGRKLQLVGVVLFGLIALAVMFLDDPAVVEELRELYDGFFG